jgi:hypothetical protein
MWPRSARSRHAGQIPGTAAVLRQPAQHREISLVGDDESCAVGGLPVPGPLAEKNKVRR